MDREANADKLAVADISELKADTKRKSATSALAQQIARREKIANNQRKRLFDVIIWIVCGSIVAVGVFVLFLGSEVLTLATPVAVAFISAMAVQSFVLIGLLARGLFMHPKPAVPAQPVE